jgi:hypothetical protein
MLPPRASCNVSWFIDGNLVRLIEKFFPARWSAGRSKLVVHIDNAPADNSRTTQNFFGHGPLNRLPWPLSSFDISSSDFHLFGKVQSTLIRQEISDEIDLLQAVTRFRMAFQMLNCNASFGVGSNLSKGWLTQSGLFDRVNL